MYQSRPSVFNTGDNIPMGEVNFPVLVFALIMGPISITWLALAFFLFMSDADESHKQGDLFDDK